MKPAIQIMLWIFLIFAVAFGSVWQFYPLPDANIRMNTLPLTGNDFNGQNIPLSDFEKDFFSGVEVIKRVYWIEHGWYLVTLLDGTHNRHLVHDPRFCFRGAGWTIINEVPYPLKKWKCGFGDID